MNPKGDRRLYFAYGSNMDPEQMAERCPGSCALGAARLDDRRFLINKRGYATIEPSPKDFVWGVLWSIKEGHIALLDEYEGVAEGMYHHEFPHCQLNGHLLKPLVYVDPVFSEGESKADYMERVVYGGRFFILPETYMDQLEARWSP